MSNNLDQLLGETSILYPQFEEFRNGRLVEETNARRKDNGIEPMSENSLKIYFLLQNKETYCDSNPELYEKLFDCLADAVEEKDLQRVELTGVNFYGKTIRNTVFNYAILKDCNLNKAVLRQVNFYRADLSNLGLTEAQLEETDFDSAQIRDVVMYQAKLTSVSMQQADITNIELGQTVMQNVHFSNSYISNGTMVSSQMSDVYFNEAKMNSVSMMACRMSNVEISGTIMNDVVFDQAAMVEVNMRGAQMTAVDMVNVYFGEVRLAEAIMDRVRISIAGNDTLTRPFRLLQQEGIEHIEVSDPEEFLLSMLCGIRNPHDWVQIIYMLKKDGIHLVQDRKLLLALDEPKYTMLKHSLSLAGFST